MGNQHSRLATCEYRVDGSSQNQSNGSSFRSTRSSRRSSRRVSRQDMEQENDMNDPEYQSCSPGQIQVTGDNDHPADAANDTISEKQEPSSTLLTTQSRDSSTDPRSLMRRKPRTRSASPSWHWRYNNRAQSVLSFAPSDLSSNVSGGHLSSVWSGGMFSQIDGGSSSSITTATEFSSTISRRSLCCQDWPVNDKIAITSSSPSTYHPEPFTSTKIVALLEAEPSKSHAIFREAFSSVQSRDHQIELFKAATYWSQKTSDPCALVWVARCLVDGWGTDQDAETGFSQLKNMAALGCWEAYYPLAECYLEGIQQETEQKAAATVVASDKSQAIHWLNIAANLDPRLVEQQEEARIVVGLAHYRLGELYFKGQGVPEDTAKALECFKTSAQYGNKYGQYILGVYYEKGIDVDKDLELAKKFYLASAEQDFPDAQAALGILLVDENPDDEQARQWLGRASKADNARALIKLGIMHEHGQGVEIDYSTAVSYYTAAALRANDPTAQYIVGLNYRIGGLGLQRDDKEAAQYLLQSARAGFAPAQRVVGLMFAQGLIGRRDEKTAFLWFRRAASQGDVRAICLVGSCYERGAGGLAVNLEAALDHYRRAARITGPFQGPAQWAMAQLLFRMNRHTDAFNWFKRASETVSPDDDSPAATAARRARLMVARYHLHGWAGVPRDPSTAFTMLTSLAQSGTRHQEAGAHYWLAACYEEGIPGVCPINLQKAFCHYMIAARSGDMDAEFQVALMLSNGQGVERDREAAFPWYEKAAQKGHKVALYSLGLYYAKGLGGIRVDTNRARVYFEKAARKGVPSAMTSLATLYRMAAYGRQHHLGASSLPKSLHDQQEQRELMVYWYQKAAEAGDAVAQRELGVLYDAGIGVTQNHAKAFDLLRKAADQKDARATLLLGSYYQNGLAVQVDTEKALELYHEATRLGASVGPFAAAQLYHSLGRFEEAFTQYKIAAQDSSLANSRIGRTSKYMVARYVLSYVPSPSQDQDGEITTLSPDLLEGMTTQDAFQILFDLANKDEFEAAFFWLGECYRTGNGVDIDLEKAFQWYRRAADEAKDVEAMVKIAAMLEQGEGTNRNLVLAFRYYQYSAEQGHPEGQHKMGMAHWRGLFNVPINLGEAVVWFTKAATKYAASSWALGQMALENGDQDVAIEWWQKAIARGHVPSMRALASLLVQSSGDLLPNNKSLECAMDLLAEAVRSGDAESLVLVGQLHQAGAIAMKPKDSPKKLTAEAEDEDEEAEMILQKQREQQELATRCFQQAAAMGNVEGMFLAAQSWHAQQQFAAALEYYERAAACGHALSRVMRARYRIAGLAGIPADPEAGYQELLECAKNENCVDAYNSLGQCHELGLGTVQDDRLALEWYLRSAEATQDAEAMFRIGQMHAQGRVPSEQLDDEHHKDMEAMQWYQFACESCNHPRAHYYLGLYHLRGITHESRILLPPDPSRAIHHFRQAAEQNDRDSMFELGQLLLVNIETADEAVDWLERSAQLGCADAQRELGRLCHLGHHPSVPQDFEKAYDYFCRAAQQGDKVSSLFIGSYHEHGIHVPPNLELAREWYEIAVKLGQSSSTSAASKAGPTTDTSEGWWLAEFALARLLHQQTETMPEAYRLFKAAHDHAPSDQKTAAAIMLCRYQLYGWGNVPARPAEAASTLIELAEAGEHRVFFQVAQCYDLGLGVALDRKQAFVWYNRHVTYYQTRIEEQDDEDWMDEEEQLNFAEALFRLAVFHKHGWAVPADPAKAAHFYHLAAERGYHTATQNGP